MAAQHSGSWYVAARPTSYSALGFILALLGATLLAGGLDLLGQFAYAILNGGSIEAVLRTIATSVAAPGSVADDRQVQMIGVAVEFGVTLVFVLIYLVAAWRSSLVNSAPEISFLWFGLLIGAVMMFGVLPLRGGAYHLSIGPAELIGQLLRYVFLVALPIATVAKVAARNR